MTPKDIELQFQEYKDAVDLSFSVTKHDKEGKIFYANKLFCEQSKLTFDEALSGIINPLNNPNTDKNKIFEILSEDGIYRDRQTFNFEDKQDHIIDITAVAIFSESSEIIEYLVFSNDVSDIVYAARKIKEQEIDSKIQKLHHVKEINRVKDTFLTVFTHELKTPLNSIINFSEYVTKHLKKETFAKKERLLEQLLEITSSGWQMLNMISNLMEAIKIKDSKLELSVSKLSAQEVLSNALKANEKMSQKRVLQLVLEGDVTLVSDETYLLKIFNNIISNAVKYSHSDVRIKLYEKGDEFVLEVEDDGDGFLKKESAFMLFEQSDEDNMTRTSTGTGVGLYVVKRLCDRMGYIIAILDSKELGGARVIVKGKRVISE